MDIVSRSIRVIEYNLNRVVHRNTPETFNEYVQELIDHINTNTAVRLYQSRSNATEVITKIKDITRISATDDSYGAHIDIIANRLLSKEIAAQDRVARLHTNVQKGSLIQALLHDTANDEYQYLLAKVEHGDFVDDVDFTFKTGFSKDKKTIWKSCLFENVAQDESYYRARVYTNTVAKYWTDDFLELDCVRSDEANTGQAFDAIDITLNVRLRSDYPRDKIMIRNAFISHLRNNIHIDFTEMVEVILGNYYPYDISQEKVLELKQKMLQLPEQKKFDRQFTCERSAIHARIKKEYLVYTGVTIKISEGFNNLDSTITAFQDADGEKFLKIRTDNETTYKTFFPRRQRNRE